MSDKSDQTVYEHLAGRGMSRREFFKLAGALAALMGLEGAAPVLASGLPAPQVRTGSPAQLVARALQSKPRPVVIWLEMQDCAGCTEALTRSHSPTLSDLVLDTIDIEYHETLFAAAGAQAEAAKKAAMQKYAGQYILVVEGSIPTAGAGFCTIGGQSALDSLNEAAAGAAAIIATGNCAAFGGLPKAQPNPTGARGVGEIIKDKPVLNIPGCPAIPEVFTGTLLHYLVFGSLPQLDALGRPMTFYGRTVHDRCLRRPFYEAGRFAQSFDDEGRAKAIVFTSWAARARPPTMPARSPNGTPGCLSRSSRGTLAWAARSPTSGTAAASIRASRRRSCAPPSAWPELPLRLGWWPAPAWL